MVVESGPLGERFLEVFIEVVLRGELVAVFDVVNELSRPNIVIVLGRRLEDPLQMVEFGSLVWVDDPVVLHENPADVLVLGVEAEDFV